MFSTHRVPSAAVCFLKFFPQLYLAGCHLNTKYWLRARICTSFCFCRWWRRWVCFVKRLLWIFMFSVIRNKTVGQKAFGKNILTVLYWMWWRRNLKQKSISNFNQSIGVLEMILKIIGKLYSILPKIIMPRTKIQPLLWNKVSPLMQGTLFCHFLGKFFLYNYYGVLS